MSSTVRLMLLVSGAVVAMLLIVIDFLVYFRSPLCRLGPLQTRAAKRQRLAVPETTTGEAATHIRDRLHGAADRIAARLRSAHDRQILDTWEAVMTVYMIAGPPMVVRSTEASVGGSESGGGSVSGGRSSSSSSSSSS